MFYLVVMGILDCWPGIILYIISLIKKSKGFFISGFIFEMICILGGIMTDSNLNLYNSLYEDVISLIFFSIFSLFVGIKIYKYSKSNNAGNKDLKNNDIKEDINNVN